MLLVAVVAGAVLTGGGALAGLWGLADVPRCCCCLALRPGWSRFSSLSVFSGGNLPCVACLSGGLPQAPNGIARVWGEALPRMFKVARRQGGNAMFDYVYIAVQLSQVSAAFERFRAAVFRVNVPPSPLLLPKTSGVSATAVKFAYLFTVKHDGGVIGRETAGHLSFAAAWHDA